MDEVRWLSSSKTIKIASEYPFNVPYVPFRWFAGGELLVCHLSVEFSNQTTHYFYVSVLPHCSRGQSGDSTGRPVWGSTGLYLPIAGLQIVDLKVWILGFELYLF